jgi:hypothetical protein
VILLWGLESDAPLAMVGEALAAAGAPVFFLDQQLVARTLVSLAEEPVGAGTLDDGSHLVELSEVTAAYVRPFDTRRIPEVEDCGPSSLVWQTALATDDSLICWCDTTPALVVNRPSAMASNNSKPYQLALIRECGFSVPDTLVTTNPEAARAFWERHGEVVYKSVSGIRSIVKRLDRAGANRLVDITNCPTQLQEYVSGTDVRVHVVGDEIFAAEVRSEADDYRYPGPEGNVAIVETSIPASIEERARATARALGLSVAGLDLRRTAAGEWFCFEANPSPGFSYYEHSTGQPIAAAISMLLTRAESNGPVEHHPQARQA